MKNFSTQNLVFLLTLFVLSFFGGEMALATEQEGDLTWQGQRYYWGGQNRGVAVDNSGVYIVGYDTQPFTNTQWHIEKRNLTTGDLIPTFGPGGYDGDGVVTFNPSSANDIAYDVAVDDSGLYIVGDDMNTGSTETQWLIKKIDKNTGADIGAGLWTKNYDRARYNESAFGVAVDSTGVYVVGMFYSQAEGLNYVHWRVERRNKDNGDLIWFREVDNGGNPIYGIAQDVALDSTDVYVVGSTNGGNGQWRMAKRNKDSASELWVKLSDSNSSRPESALGVAVDYGGAYIVGYDNFLGNAQWRIEKRNLTTGDLIPTFGPGGPDGNGAISVNPSNNNEEAQRVVADSTGLYVVGSDYSLGSGNARWRLEKRDLNNGEPNTTFGTGGDDGDGVVTSNPSGGNDIAYDVALDSTTVYITGNAIEDQRIERRQKYRDIGLRYYDGANKIAIAAESPNLITSLLSLLRIRKSTTTYGLVLVDPNDANASKIKIKTSSGIKALAKIILPSKDLVNGIHSSTECTGAGGVVINDGQGNDFCKFTASSCPSGWTQYNDWSTTAPATCNAPGPNPCGFFQPGTPGCASAGCTTPSHVWGNTFPETCNYGGGCFDALGRPISCQGWTCTAAITQIGCY